MPVGFRDKRVAQTLKGRAQVLPDSETERITPYDPLHRFYPQYTPDILLAKTPVGGISGCSDTTLYSAVCKVQKATRSGGTVTYGNAKMDNDSDDWEETIFNPSKASVGGDKLIAFALTKYGFYIVVVESCE